MVTTTLPTRAETGLPPRADFWPSQLENALSNASFEIRRGPFLQPPQLSAEEGLATIQKLVNSVSLTTELYRWSLFGHGAQSTIEYTLPEDKTLQLIKDGERYSAYLWHGTPCTGLSPFNIETAKARSDALVKLAELGPVDSEQMFRTLDGRIEALRQSRAEKLASFKTKLLEADPELVTQLTWNQYNYNSARTRVSLATKLGDGMEAVLWRTPKNQSADFLLTLECKRGMCEPNFVPPEIRVESGKLAKLFDSAAPLAKDVTPEWVMAQYKAAEIAAANPAPAFVPTPVASAPAPAPSIVARLMKWWQAL